MSREPARWLDSEEQPELLSLMRVGADELAPPEALARIGERLRESALVSEKSREVPPTSRRPRAGTRVFGVKAGAAAVLLLVLGLSLYLTLRSRRTVPVDTNTSSAQPRALPPDTERVVPAPLDPPATATHPDGAEAPPLTRPDHADAERRLKKKSGHKSEPRVVPIDTRLLEAKLLEQARQELSTRPDRALILLRDHATQFPSSWLEEERAALSIRALVATGQRTEARAQLTQFEARFAGSLHTPRLERALIEH